MYINVFIITIQGSTGIISCVISSIISSVMGVISVVISGGSSATGGSGSVGRSVSISELSTTNGLTTSYSIAQTGSIMDLAANGIVGPVDGLTKAANSLSVAGLICNIVNAISTGVVGQITASKQTASSTNTSSSPQTTSGTSVLISEAGRLSIGNSGSVAGPTTQSCNLIVVNTVAATNQLDWI
ncbi:hypothetical protein ACTA71_004554 [Dictyostelium dimigraforme]